mmetsp:Transcript_35037/g.65398  ORF Transcript_35037/g.65398 Transcript_35037/m.65398 type:complete len:123 (+) Transcript_35037:217-585(+)
MLRIACYCPFLRDYRRVLLVRFFKPVFSLSLFSNVNASIPFLRNRLLYLFAFCHVIVFETLIHFIVDHILSSSSRELCKSNGFNPIICSISEKSRKGLLGELWVTVTLAHEAVRGRGSSGDE